MRAEPLGAGFLVGLLVLSGCAASEGAGPADAGPSAAFPAEFDENTGGLEGIVTDDALAPLAGALVGLLDRDLTTETDAEGRYSFSKLAPGRVQVVVQQLGYGSSSRSVEVLAGQVTRANFELVALAVEEAYHVTQQGVGRTFCGMAWRTPVPALNGALAACGVFYGTPIDNVDTFVVVFTLSAENVSKIRAIVFETQWQATQAFGSGMDVLWEAYQDILAYTFTEPVRRFARVQGPSPLHIVVDDDTIKQNVTKHKPPPKYCAPGGKCKLWARNFPYASTLGPSAPADVAIYYDQRYTHYVTEFFGDYPPPKFSVLPDR